MKANRKYIIFILGFLWSLSSMGKQDSAIALSFSNYMEMVYNYHPIAKQAALLISNASANKLKAKGNFDPKLYYDFRNKFYESKNYYALSDGGIEVPTWWGISVKAGVENNNGQFLNPENNVPAQGLMYAQISMSLLRGLVIDERRASLKQAKVFEQLSEFEKRNMINELLYKAGKTYWDWYVAYLNMQVIQSGIVLSKERLNAVSKSVQLGDRPAIDTVEANIQLQDRLLQLQQAELEYLTQSLMVSNYLWLENDIPIVITAMTIPEDNISENSNLNVDVDQLDSLINNHPSLKVYEYKLNLLAIDRKLKIEQLKPNLNLNFNPLLSNQNMSMGYQNDYKWGLSVGFPVLLRKERGELKMVNIKIESINFENINKRNELVNQASTSLIAFKNYLIQQEIYNNNVSNYRQLWQSEKRLFDTGESSLFMINSREISYINAQIKLNEIIMKNRKAALDVEYTFGLLGS